MDFFEGRQPIHFGHTNIEDHGIGWIFPHHFHGFLSVFGFDDFVIDGFKRFAGQSAQVRVIINNRYLKDSRFWVHEMLAFL